jgi:signal transduction histidine kinase
VLPGWRLGLAFQGADPFAEGATGHRTLYLLAGTLAAAATLALALLAVRYLRAQLELAQLRSDLVSAVTHELKTPLASTSALLETLLSGRYRDEAQWRHYLELIARENQRLGRLIDNFLAFSRLDRRPTAMTLQPLHLPAVVDTACRSMGERWSAPDCEWTVEVEPNLPELRGDPEALTAAVVNLLDNAWKYTSPPRRIGLRVFRANHHLQVEVTDNGTGIAPAEQQRVFEPYYQGDRGLTRRSAGCGLGLAIVRFVAEAHHGRAQVSSRPGGGSVFTLSLPESLAADGAEAGRRPPTPS